MIVWAVANQKGGVGKTTTVANLAGWLATEPGKTLLVDLDPHGSLTTYFGRDTDDVERSVYTLFENRSASLASIVAKTAFQGLFLMPASPALATLDRQLGSQDGMGLVISQTLKRLENHFDHVIIDCPPVLGVLMVNALAACDRLIIPVQTEFLALKGLERMLRTITMITRSRKMELPHTIVPTLFDRRTRASVQTLDCLKVEYGARLWPSVIPVDTQLREASQAHTPLPLMAPKSRGAVAYRALLDDLRRPLAADGETAVA